MDAFLFNYIEYLLPEYNCVTIPDFGSFIANTEPAQYSPNDGAYKVPCYKVIFNPDLKHNDGLLASYIHTDENISYKAAQAKIKEAVKNIKISLNQVKELQCGRIGTFKLDENNSILFSANKDMLSPYLYGLSSVNLLRLHELSDRGQRIRPKSRIKYIYGTVAAAAAIVLFFAMPGANVQDSANSNNQQQASFVSSLTMNSDFGLNKKAAIEPIVEQDVQAEANAAIANRAQEAKPHPYYIIIGGDVSLKRANDYLDQIKKTDFPSAEIVKSADRYRVYVASFADKLEGEIYLEKFRMQNPEYETAWLYTHRQ